MQYTESIIMLLLWPVFIFLSFLFVKLNLKHFHKLERLEELEQQLGRQTGSQSQNNLR